MKRCLRGLALMMLCLFALNTTVFASNIVSPRASSYIVGTNAYITPESNGLLIVTFSISAYGEMSEIGATSVEIYEDNGHTTKRVATYNYTDPAYSFMMGKNEGIHAKDISYNGTVGYKYYAKVYFRASNSFGGDAVTETTPVVTAKK